MSYIPSLCADEPASGDRASLVRLLPYTLPSWETDAVGFYFVRVCVRLVLLLGFWLCPVRTSL